MKTDEIRLLFFDTDEMVVKRAIRELRNIKPKITFARVETRDEFQNQMQENCPDLILCDPATPELSGMKLLETTFKTGVEIPVLIWTGKLTEEVVTACIRSGAVDFILKSRLKNLASTVDEILNREKKRIVAEKNKQALWNFEARYRTFVDSTSDTAFLKDENLRYVVVNKAIRTLLGKSEGEIIGKTDFELMPEKSAAVLAKSDVKSIENKSLIVTNERIGNRTFESWKFPVVLSNGETGVGGFIHEIMLRPESETQIKFQGATLYNADNALVISDTNGTILSVNPAFTRLTGYTAEEALGKNLINLTRSDAHTDGFYAELWDTVRKGNVWHGYRTSLAKSGKTFNEEVTMIPMVDTHGTVTQCIILEQLVADGTLTMTGRQEVVGIYQQMVENSNIGIFTSTMQGKLTYVNEAMRKMLDYTSTEDLLKTSLTGIFANPDKWSTLKASLISTNRLMNYEVELIARNGIERNAILNLILDGNKIISLVTDNTKNRRVINRMLKAKTKAEESDRMKSHLLSVMSHDIRIPINAIQGFVDLLTMPGLKDDERLEYINQVSRGSQHLLKLVNNFVEISKVVAGELSANPVSFELNAFMRDILNETNPAAARKNLNLQLNTGMSDSESHIRFDDQKIRQVLHNLLDNAIKFSDTGTIEFGYDLRDSILEFYVKDSGRGISQKHQEMIFERFRKIDDPYTRTNDGSGLGLALAKAYVEFLGGSIRVISHPGKGSNFIFSIPYVPDETRVKIKESRLLKGIDLNNRKILVAEDDETNYMFMERLLTKANATILRAVSGQDAVDRCAADSNIDLVLMDINMPNMNGLEATRIIKSKTPGLPIIAVTAYAVCDDRETCIEAGCDEYIPKPVHRDELFMKLNTCLTN